MVQRAVFLFQKLGPLEIRTAVENRVVKNGLAKEVRALETDIGLEMGVAELRIQMKLAGSKGDRRLHQRAAKDRWPRKNKALENAFVFKMSTGKIRCRKIQPKPRFIVTRFP